MDSNLQSRVQSKDFEQRVNSAADAFMQDLESMLSEEQQISTASTFSRPFSPLSWLSPA